MHSNFIDRKAFVFEYFSNQLNIFVGCNLSFTKSLNTSYIEWMDNLMQIEYHQKICHLFPISNLTHCKCVALKEKLFLILFKIIVVIRPSTFLRVFFMGDQNLQLSERLGRALPTHVQNAEPHPSVGCHSPLKELIFLLLLHASPCPSRDSKSHIGEKCFYQL